ncbi:MAG TPA: DAK2 domain-containing protein [Candidatus Nitrosocosmicus sp.]|nr:DAK2 domain-containing protein [Candidatus Nitrosocosmicus sp.]
MSNLTHEDLKRMLICASDQVLKHKDVINEVNVFPVPDSDTGSNLSSTLIGIKDRISSESFSDLNTFIDATLKQALLSSQGNSGIIFSGFLNGWLSVLQHKKEINISDLSMSVIEGKKAALKSIQEPLPGTMLDLINAFSIAITHAFREQETDIPEVIIKMLPVLRKKVYETENKMEVLKKNHVVDAGAVGFYFIVKGFAIALGMKDEEEKSFVNNRKQIRPYKEDITDHIYEVVSIIDDSSLSQTAMRELLSSLGNCLDIIQIGKQTKIHIHTDTPEIVNETIEVMGDVISTQTIDMRDNSIYK